MSYKVRFVIDLRRGEQALADSSLGILLSALTSIDESYLAAHSAVPLLYQSGVRYQREPGRREDWQDIPTTLKRRTGDCEDLACWRAAELRCRYGLDAHPIFRRKLVLARGHKVIMYHILVRFPSGAIEDPSRKLGMGSNLDRLERRIFESLTY